MASVVRFITGSFYSIILQHAALFPTVLSIWNTVLHASFWYCSLLTYAPFCIGSGERGFCDSVPAHTHCERNCDKKNWLKTIIMLYQSIFRVVKCRLWWLISWCTIAENTKEDTVLVDPIGVSLQQLQNTAVGLLIFDLMLGTVFHKHRITTSATVIGNLRITANPVFSLSCS